MIVVASFDRLHSVVAVLSKLFGSNLISLYSGNHCDVKFLLRDLVYRAANPDFAIH
jgi:hypothetical protein